MPVEVPREVRRAVLAWADTDGLEAAARVLKAGHAGMSEDHARVLRREVAEVLADTLHRLLDEPYEATDDDVAEILGVTLPRPVAERVAALLSDQIRTADALALDLDAW